MTDVQEFPMFEEAAELFGAPSTDDAMMSRISDIFGLIVLSQNGEEPLRDTLVRAALQAVDVQGEAYTDVLNETASTCLALGSTEHEHLRAFFHKAARFGEVRMLANIITALFALMASTDAGPAPTRH